MVVNLEKSFSMKNEKEDPENPVYPGLTKPGEVGDFFAMVSISVVQFLSKSKVSVLSVFSSPYFFHQ
jgi:hypothetical protein